MILFDDLPLGLHFVFQKIVFSSFSFFFNLSYRYCESGSVDNDLVKGKMVLYEAIHADKEPVIDAAQETDINQ